MNSTPKRLDKYELLERLGHGGVAEVWKAQDTQLQRFVAIKLLHPNLRDNPNFLTRFQREARLIASLHHPNIVQIHDFQVMSPPGPDNEDNGTLAYMVMDYIEGGTLADYIQRTSGKGQIPSPAEIVNLFTSISLAVDFAHQKEMVHRDIKPANILLDTNNTTRNPMGEPLLTDFGVARLMNASSNTMSGAQLGTPLYISPEQAKGYPGNERSDIYSLGVILYEMVTGVTPFRGDTPVDVISQHLNTQPTSPELINPRIPPSLTMVVMRSLAKDPATRFPSAASLTAAIADALGLPIPESLGTPTFPMFSTDPPTALKTPAFSPLANPVSGSGIAGVSGSAGSSPAGQGQYASLGPMSQPMPSQPTPGLTPGTTPGFTPLIVHPIQDSGPSAPPIQPMPSLPGVAGSPPWYQGGQQSIPTPPPSRGRRGLWITIISVLLLISLGVAGWGAYMLYVQPPAAANGVVGHAFFVSSGLVQPGSAKGIADQLQIDLQNVPAHQAGKSYYAWLLGDKHPDTNEDLTGPRPVHSPILLTNDLPVVNGSVHYLYKGDGQQNNLISNVSRFLITEEPAGQTPATPSLDSTTWRFYAELPQTQIPGDNPGFTALTHIRHLFYNETNIKVLGLPGGLDVWLLKNTEKVLEWAISARDDYQGAATSQNNINLMSDQFVRILDYLDGSANVHIDLPANVPLLVDPLAAKVALLTVNPNQQTAANLPTDPPGHVDHIQLHVGQVAKATDITPETRQQAARIIDAVNRAKGWLLQVRQDALQLYKMSVQQPDQLKQPQALEILNDLVSQATFAYLGQLDPTTNQVLPGVLQAHFEIQQLASLAITKNLPQTLALPQ